MKKISLALSFLSFVAFLYPAEAGSAFKPVKYKAGKIECMRCFIRTIFRII